MNNNLRHFKGSNLKEKISKLRPIMKLVRKFCQREEPSSFHKIFLKAQNIKLSKKKIFPQILSSNVLSEFNVRIFAFNFWLYYLLNQAS